MRRSEKNVDSDLHSFDHAVSRRLGSAAELQEKEEEANSLLDLGDLFLKSRKVHLAESLYQRYIQSFSEDFRGYLKLGLLYANQKVLKKDPIFINSNSNSNSSSNNSNSNSNSSISSFIDPDVVRRRQLEQSLKFLHLAAAKAKSTGIQEPEIQGSMAAVYIKLNLIELAMAECLAGLEMDKNNCLCFYNFNVSLRMNKETERAIRITSNSMKLSGIGSDLYDLLILSSQNNVPLETDDSINSSSTTVDVDKIQLVDIHCVKWGKKYGALYVNRLYNMVRLHFPSNIRLGSFICHTDDRSGILKSIECRDFPAEVTAWTTWWLKGCVFKEALHERDSSDDNDISSSSSSSSGGSGSGRSVHGRWSLYIDLDTIIVDSMDFLFSLPSLSHNNYLFYTLNAGSFACEGRHVGINSSIMLWRSDCYKEIYDILLQNYKEITDKIYKFDHFMEMLMFNKERKDTGGKQVCDDAVQMFRCGFIQSYFSDKVKDYMTIEPFLRLRSSNSAVAALAAADFPLSSPATSSTPPPCNTTSMTPIDGLGIVCFPLHPKPEHLDDKWLLACWGAS